MIRQAQAGLSIIELMVGALIGMIGVLVILQSFSVFEGQRRTTGSGNDAQTVGALALYALQREIRLGGYGFGTAPAATLGCKLDAAYATAAGTGPTGIRLAPVQISKAATPGQADEVIVTYAASEVQVAPMPILSASGKSIGTKATAGITPGDYLLAAAAGTPGDCAVRQVEAVDPATKTIALRGASPTVGFVVGASLFNLGRDAASNGLAINRYFLNNDRLLVEDMVGGTISEVAGGVVGIQFEYGIATNVDGIVDQWVSTLPVPTDWSRVRAIRMGVAVRSGQFERVKVTSDANQPKPSWTGAAAFAMKDVGGTSDSNGGGPDGNASNWRNYRYRVFESVIPLVNVMWGTGA